MTTRHSAISRRVLLLPILRERSETQPRPSTDDRLGPIQAGDDEDDKGGRIEQRESETKPETFEANAATEAKPQTEWETLKILE